MHYKLIDGRVWEYNKGNNRLIKIVGQVVDNKIDVTNEYFTTTFLGKKEIEVMLEAVIDGIKVLNETMHERYTWFRSERIGDHSWGFLNRQVHKRAIQVVYNNESAKAAISAFLKTGKNTAMLSEVCPVPILCIAGGVGMSALEGLYELEDGMPPNEIFGAAEYMYETFNEQYPTEEGILKSLQEAYVKAVFTTNSEYNYLIRDKRARKKFINRLEMRIDDINKNFEKGKKYTNERHNELYQDTLIEFYDKIIDMNENYQDSKKELDAELKELIDKLNT